MSDDDERVTDSEQGWSEKDRWEEDSEKGTEGEVGDSCELAPHSAMSVGAGRVDSPSPQDIRLLHDLVEDLTKEQEEKIRPRAEQVSHFSIFPTSNRIFSSFITGGEGEGDTYLSIIVVSFRPISLHRDVSFIHTFITR